MKLITILSTLVFSVAAWSQTATYEVTIESNWTREAHLALPGNAHFSPVVAISHNQGFELLPIGGIAGPAFERIAEMGQTARMERALRTQMRRMNADDVVVTENQFVLRQPEQTFEITVSEEFPMVSFVSMIAPSPDWVIGAANLQLYSRFQGFKAGVTRMPLYAIDAGTENGDFGGNFSLNNRATSPKAPINVLLGRGFDEPFAYVTFRKIN